MNIINKSESRDNWKARIIEWRQSGISQAKYCKRNSLDPRQFSKWKLKLEDPEDESSFIELPLGEMAESLNGDIDIKLKIKQSGEILISVKPK